MTIGSIGYFICCLLMNREYFEREIIVYLVMRFFCFGLVFVLVWFLFWFGFCFGLVWYGFLWYSVFRGC